ncbi:unnamed protein product [Symbiodinium natans]|uniref:Uncharacterized protein n=1 Tax=Symbiodinium natans TaxID=878477 RepID=A0A812UFL8_9DINO|nr:unnamed protein product [Symbiodinium natans]
MLAVAARQKTLTHQRRRPAAAKGEGAGLVPADPVERILHLYYHDFIQFSMAATCDGALTVIHDLAVLEITTSRLGSNMPDVDMAANDVPADLDPFEDDWVRDLEPVALIFEPSAKYHEHDALNHGLRRSASESNYSMSNFRTIDISKVNEDRHQWQRLDTFHTPFGHCGDIEDPPKPGKPGCRFRHEMLEQFWLQMSKQMKQQFDLNTEILRGEMQRFSAEMSANFALLRADVAKRTCDVDFTQVLEAIHAQKQVKLDLDFSTITSAIQANKADLSEVLRAIREHKPDVDFTSVFAAIDAKKVDVDFAPVMAAIDAAKVHVDFSPVLAAIDAKKVDVDFSSVIAAVDAKKVDIDFSAVLDAIREHKPDIDFSPVIAAIDAKKIDVDLDLSSAVTASSDAAKLDVDFSEVLQAIREHKPKVDFSPVIAAIDAKKVDVDVDLSSVIASIGARKLDVDFSEVLQAIREQKPAVDLSSVVAAVDAKKVDVDLSEVLKAINEKKCDVDFTQVLQAIREQKLDVSPVLAAIDAKKLDVDLSQVKVDVDISAIMTAIEANKPDAHFSEVLQAIRDVTLDVDFSEILKEIRNIKVDVDISQVLQTLREHTDPRPILDAIAGITASVTAHVEANFGVEVRAVHRVDSPNG